MIVYGSSSRRAALSHLVRGLERRVGRALHRGGSLEDARSILIGAGELEQAVFDHPEPCATRAESARARAASFQATDLAARALLAAYRPHSKGSVRALLRAVGRALAAVPASETRLRVRIPEGYAYYGLYPEQYDDAALRWHLDHAPTGGDHDVVVVGVRSIGTSLSAVVAARLASLGWRVRRATVRPAGHPFQRRVRLRGSVRGMLGLVVDEGPGLSGSSMIATASALMAAGAERVALLPGHRNGPGLTADSGVRGWWRRLPAYVGDVSHIRLGGVTLARALWRSIPSLRGDEPHAAALDLAGGAWRAHVFDRTYAWPAVCRAWERPKLLAFGRSGRRVLFKFMGFATAPGGRRSLAERASRRASGALGTAHGWVAMEWNPERALMPSDTTPERMERLGAHVASRRGPAPSADAAARSRARLTSAVRANLIQALGADAARDATERLARAADRGPVYGDGRLAPHEWRPNGSGADVRVGVSHPGIDHTWVGRQPVAWDLAAALLEWNARSSRDDLRRGFESTSGLQVSDADLDAFELAYAAHRLGQLTHAAAQETDAEDRQRLETARDGWRDLARRIVAVPAETA
jgi:hypothetical protein